MSRSVVDRIDPQMATDERTTLVEFLDYHRATIILKAAGLADEQALRRALPPSTLSLTGLVRHMAEVEQVWFRQILLGEDVTPLFSTADEPDLDIEPPTTATMAEAVTALENQIRFARAAIAGRSLDQLSAAARPDGHPNLRWILVHMIEEYARHCGHADLLRQAIDGVVGD